MIKQRRYHLTKIFYLYYILYIPDMILSATQGRCSLACLQHLSSCTTQLTQLLGSVIGSYLVGDNLCDLGGAEH